MKSYFSPTAAVFRWLLIPGSVFLVFSSFTYTGCTSKKASANDPVQIKESKTGLASYYGPGFQGKETASGETFDSREWVAAHPSYPLGSVARVTNLENNRTVTVRIIDRGPTDENVAEGVIIDLSKGAARELGMVKDGRVQVKVDILQWGNNERQ